MEIIKGNLYKSKDTGVIVMAEQKLGENNFSGQVVIDGDYVKGYFSNMWAIHIFQPYSAEIIIKEVIDFSKVQFLEMASGEILFTNGNHKETSFCGTRVVDGYFLEWWKKDSVKKIVTPNFK
jgi:hypothetical protein